ncbi:MAG: UDP-glucose/GDP-mannose dehydrogenase family protein [Verrucomicrobia bacterium]|nr:MAG: UDP-glucose/GDP-mannose dehydrogenase family protein [Verrucomicrobiota bacterium]
MNITVAGLWHLGCVTAACCARHFRVTGFDSDSQNIAQLKQGKAPLLEPGLNELLVIGVASGNLQFTDEPRSACADADILWLTYDTPVNDNDESDVAFVLDRLRSCLGHLPPGALVLISSQLPVGTCRQLEAEFPQFHFACSPENLRLGRAIEAFEKAERVVVGVRDDRKKALLEELFRPFTPQILWMRTESAEMVKHALNSFLALSITFINEIARLCEPTGADAKEVATGLKSDPRIGPRAYLNPGGPFAGGTLARDVMTLTRLGAEKNDPVAVIAAIKQSNDRHRSWAFRRLESRLGTLRGKCVAVLGLTYKPGTDTLRRSAAIELCRKLLDAGATVKAFDPAVKILPPELASITFAENLAAAVMSADAAVVCTEWPEFLLRVMRQRLFIDANSFLEKELKTQTGVEHLSVGRA